MPVPLTCTYCSFQYPTAQLLKLHHDTWRPCCHKFHGDNPKARGIKPYPERFPCENCRLRYDTPDTLQDHSRTPFCSQNTADVTRLTVYTLPSSQDEPSFPAYQALPVEMVFSPATISRPRHDSQGALRDNTNPTSNYSDAISSTLPQLDDEVSTPAYTVMPARPSTLPDNTRGAAFKYIDTIASYGDAIPSAQRQPSVGPSTSVNLAMLDELDSLPTDALTEEQISPGKMSRKQAIERAIRDSMIIHEPGQYKCPPCDFCRPKLPHYREEAVHKICSDCSEDFLSSCKEQYVQDIMVLNGISSTNLSDSSQSSHPALSPSPTEPMDTTSSSGAPVTAGSSSIATPDLAPPRGYVPSSVSKIVHCDRCCLNGIECWMQDPRNACYSCKLSRAGCTRIQRGLSSQ